MELGELKRIVRQGENSRIEFKRKVRHPEKIVRELVAFANSEGGHLFIGVDDDLSIPGLKYAQDDLFVMEQAIQELSRPVVPYKSSVILLPEKKAVIHLEISRSSKKPHYALERKNQKWGKAYVRVDDKSLQASRELCRILKGDKKKDQSGFVYGENEQVLMKYLGENNHITLHQYAKQSGLTPKNASEILVNMTLNNVLRIIPREQGDWFEFVG
jgi:predicted HTH transcriptional regulator